MIQILLGLISLVVGLLPQVGVQTVDNPDLVAAVGAVLLAWGLSRQIRQWRGTESTEPSDSAGH